MLRPLWTFFLVIMNIFGDHRLGKHQKELRLQLITVTFLARVAPKNRKRSTADVRTDYNKWSRNATLLGIDAYRKYEALRMLNLLTVLSVRLLARVPTVLTVLAVLAVPVPELELVFERTLNNYNLINKRDQIVSHFTVIVSTHQHIRCL